MHIIKECLGKVDCVFEHAASKTVWVFPKIGHCRMFTTPGNVSLIDRVRELSNRDCVHIFDAAPGYDHRPVMSTARLFVFTSNGAGYVTQLQKCGHLLLGFPTAILYECVKMGRALGYTLDEVKQSSYCSMAISVFYSAYRMWKRQRAFLRELCVILIHSI